MPADLGQRSTRLILPDPCHPHATEMPPKFVTMYILFTANFTARHY